MKKIFFSLVVLSSLVFLWFKADFGGVIDPAKPNDQQDKQEILRFAIVSDSENDNEDLGKALALAKSNNASFVVGLGDWTPLGTVEDLEAAKNVFDESGLTYFVTAGDRDLWSSRNDGNEAHANFNVVFGQSSHIIDRNPVKIVIVDNSDIYKGIVDSEWLMVNGELSKPSKLMLVMSHKAPYHPQTSHVMGADRESVAKQAQEYINLLEEKKVAGFFSGDIHFFAKFNSPNNVFKMNTIGSVSRERNFQGPSFAIVKVFDDLSWDSESIEIE